MKLERIFPCEQCGAKLSFSAATGELKCPYCSHVNIIERQFFQIVERDYEKALGELRRFSETPREITSLKCPSCAATFDLGEDTLYILVGSALYQMEGGTGHGDYTWKSKMFRLQQPVNFAAAQVFRETEGDVTFKLYADGELVHTEEVTDSDPFRLPSGFMGINYEYELTGTAIVNAVYVATTMAELRAI